MKATDERENRGHSKPPTERMADMIAIIRMPTYKAQVTVKDRLIDGTGYVRIVADNGAVYETHLANVCFVEEDGKHGKE